MMDKTALSYWFPKLEAAGLPVPRTKTLAMPAAAQESFLAAFDGRSVPGAESFIADLKALAADIGAPCFLRTDHTSNKHDWSRACFVGDIDVIGSHAMAIVEFSEMCGIIGLPWDMWVVRELLPTIPLGVCPHYSGMPVCREFRFFVEDGDVRCVHPYWPRHALEQGGCDASLDYEGLCRMDDAAALHSLAAAAGRAVGGAWSVDILETRRGWYVTDMAEAHKSWHWPDCSAADAK